MCSSAAFVAKAQNAIPYNLAAMLKAGSIVTIASYQTQVLENTVPGAISTKGINWLKVISFKKGWIDIDLCGKNVFLQSSLGSAFHGINTNNCDILYVRRLISRMPIQRGDDGR